MQIGVTYPQFDLGADAAVAREFVQTVEQLGFDYLTIFDHVLGADTKNRPGWEGPYSKDDLFHEPLVFYGYLAGLTTSLQLATSVIILPQRQTALVAKQAAEIDILSNGRLRLGVGLGWNSVEYDALGADFHTRGQRLEEQVSLLRLLWTQDVVTFSGRWDDVHEAGINPLPIQRPIPIWLGAGVVPMWTGTGASKGTLTDTALRRVARIADGWLALGDPESLSDAVLRLQRYADEFGRAPESLGLCCSLDLVLTTPDTWARTVDRWHTMGGTHISLATLRRGLASPQQHLELLAKFKERVC